MSTTLGQQIFPESLVAAKLYPEHVYTVGAAGYWLSRRAQVENGRRIKALNRIRKLRNKLGRKELRRIEAILGVPTVIPVLTRMQVS